MADISKDPIIKDILSRLEYVEIRVGLPAKNDANPPGESAPDVTTPPDVVPVEKDAAPAA